MRALIARGAYVAALVALVATAAQAQPTPSTTPSPVPIGPTGSNLNGSGSQTERQKEQSYASASYLIRPKISNEFSPGNRGRQSFRAMGEHEFSIRNLHLMVGADYRTYTYSHDATTGGTCPGDVGCVTTIGRTSQTFVSSFPVTDEQVDGRLGIKLLDPRVYLGVSYLTKYNNAGYPRSSGLGLGLEKMPDKEAPLSVYFSTYYYPNITGAYRSNGGSLGLTYRMFRYDVGVAIKPGQSPIFLDAGILGDRTTARNSAPSNESHFAPYVGLGFALR